MNDDPATGMRAVTKQRAAQGVAQFADADAIREQNTERLDLAEVVIGLVQLRLLARWPAWRVRYGIP